MDACPRLIIYCDGASRGNPGPAGAGVVLQDEQGKTLKRVYKFLGNATNNQAEYSALIVGIEEAHKLAAVNVHFRLDSELIVKQIRGQYRVRSDELLPFYQQARRLLDRIEHYSIEHVPRTLNREADQLANEAIDGHSPM